MQITYLSDLHLEFIKEHKLEKKLKNIKINKNGICVCAGDIGYPESKNYDIFMIYLSNNFKKIFVIAGNHEYYNKHYNVYGMKNILKKYFEKFNNITFLDNTYEYYEGYYFIGITLWSRVINNDYSINDLTNIYEMSYEQYNKLNNECIEYLTYILNIINDKCIVISHHVPLLELIEKKYKTDEYEKYNQWFYNDLFDLLNFYKNKIKIWIYGHTHIQSIKLINNILFMCCPSGYPGENKSITNIGNIYVELS